MNETTIGGYEVLGKRGASKRFQAFRASRREAQGVSGGTLYVMTDEVPQPDLFIETVDAIRAAWPFAAGAKREVVLPRAQLWTGRPWFFLPDVLPVAASVKLLGRAAFAALRAQLSWLEQFQPPGGEARFAHGDVRKERMALFDAEEPLLIAPGWVAAADYVQGRSLSHARGDDAWHLGKLWILESDHSFVPEGMESDADEAQRRLPRARFEPRAPEARPRATEARPAAREARPAAEAPRTREAARPAAPPPRGAGSSAARPAVGVARDATPARAARAARPAPAAPARAAAPAQPAAPTAQAARAARPAPAPQPEAPTMPPAAAAARPAPAREAPANPAPARAPAVAVQPPPMPVTAAPPAPARAPSAAPPAARMPSAAPAPLERVSAVPVAPSVPPQPLAEPARGASVPAPAPLAAPPADQPGAAAAPAQKKKSSALPIVIAILLLVAALVAALFVLERWLGSKS